MEQYMRRIFNSRMDSQLQTHMKNVYSCIALSTLSAAVGAFLHVFGVISGGLLSGLGSLALMVVLSSTPDDGKNAKKRLGYLLGFAFLTGMGLGPLLDHVLMIDPTIIPTAFFGTCLVFTCFTLASMLSNRRDYIYLGGTLMSLLSVLTISSLVNIFVGSYFLFQAHIYLGLLVFCGFILYDTQAILEKRRMGDKDYIWHSVSLFLDLVQVFRHIMVILANKEDNRKRKQ